MGKGLQPALRGQPILLFLIPTFKFQSCPGPLVWWVEGWKVNLVPGIV